MGRMSDVLISRNVMNLVLGMLVILAGIMAYRASHSKGSKFSLDDAFMDASGKTSLGRISTFAALAVSTWGFVFLTLEGKLSEWFMTAYLAAWVGNGIGHKWLDKPTETKLP